MKLKNSLAKLCNVVFLMSFFFDSHILAETATYTTKEYDFPRKTGLVTPEDKNDRHYVSVPVKADLPSRFDWREQVPGGLTPVRSQGNCGSCWSFAINAQLSDLYALKNPFFSRLVFAPQLSVSCDSRNSGCGGGYFHALDFFKTFGAVDESQFKYSASDERCASNLSPLVKIKNWFYVGASDREPTTEELKTALLLYGPLSIEIAASSAFMNYGGGVYNNCNSMRVNHMITLVGFDDSTQSWIVKNSWGESWGENGYGRIVYVQNRSGQKCLSVGSTAAAIILE